MEPDEYNSMALRALRRAHELRGVTAEAFAKLLAQRSGGSPTSSTYHRWLRGEGPVPAWVLFAAAEEANESLDALATAAELPEPSQRRLSQMEDLVGILQAEMMEVREKIGLPLSSARGERAEEDAPADRRSV